MFICGTGSFSSQDAAEDEASSATPCSTPKRRSGTFCKITARDGGSKNPYADRGLDKFYALLADLDHQKQKIYTQKGSRDIRFVRFVYANDSDHAKPIVVKVKERNHHQPPKTGKNLVEQSAEESKKNDGMSRMMVKKKCRESCAEIEKMKNHPHFYFPVMVVLILLLLAIYGRSFAVVCTSIGWYLGPTVAGERSRKGKREKREKVMKESPSSPKSVINGLHHLQQQQHE